MRGQLQGEAGAVAAHLSEARVHVETGQPVVATTGREEAGRGEGDRGFLPQPREGGVPSTTTERKQKRGKYEEQKENNAHGLKLYFLRVFPDYKKFTYLRNMEGYGRLCFREEWRSGCLWLVAGM